MKQGSLLFFVFMLRRKTKQERRGKKYELFKLGIDKSKLDDCSGC